MSVWDHIAEARIRDWLRTPPADRPSTPPMAPGLPLEVQLLADVRQLDRMAAAADDPASAEALRRQASDLMIRLLVLLEGEGRPLAAKRFAELRFQRDDPA
jgi:hypothetical protein